MIQSLYIQNFALIDDLDMSFDRGLSAMTGETGAGKSIILESLYLLFGKRSDVQMIRHGADKAYVKGVFRVPSEIQSAYEVPETISVEREIDQSGRHVMRLNDEQVTLSKIKEIMQSIGSIHAQSETMLLTDKATYLDIIDQIDPTVIAPLHQRYLMDRSHFLEKRHQLNTLSSKKEQSLERKSFLEYQIAELKSFDLKIDEKTHLDEMIEKLKHFDKIMQQVKEAYQSLDHDGFSIDAVYEAGRAMEKIGAYDTTYQTLSERLVSTYYELDDVKSELYHQLTSLDFDDAQFETMQARSYELSKIESKYQKPINELIDYLKEIETELLMLTDYDAYLDQSKKAMNEAFEKAYQSGVTLSQARQKLALRLEKDMLTELKDLDLDKASFKIVFDTPEKDPSSLLEHGLDQIDFLISLNEGEPIRPLSKVASGGERARFMFGLKSLHAKMHQISMLILDEIDIGISGRTAAKVASKMKALSEMMQLIVITHLPQVAARADHHYDITKEKTRDRMVTRITKLDDDHRIEKIAMMLSDEKLSSHAIEQAKMLLGK